MARAKGINKAKGYINRIFTIEYDLAGMIEAYGIDFVHWYADEIVAGRVNCKQSVDRWAASRALDKDQDFAIWKANELVKQAERDALDNIINGIVDAA